ncbi:FkbM family methyltransferase [Candidatus Nitrosacidococcus sp. I8]|uniref:FkbM family methyltransferase n=1 Tax=Candidatus Nitrosacidococcus sp. I8 TaxID=2942908 RepID=UPI0039B6FC00
MLKNYIRTTRITLELNGIQNVRLANVGLGVKAGQAFIKIIDNEGQALGSGSYISISPSQKDTAQYQSTNVRTIDEIIPRDREIGIIQLDVEGYEKEALSGALQTIHRCLPIIILEVNNNILVQSTWFLEKILSIGYKKTVALHNNFVFLCKT